MSMYKTFDKAKILPHLPESPMLHTFTWWRYYQKNDLLNKLVPIFEYLQCRHSLVAMLNAFEVGLRNLLLRLADTKLLGDLPARKLNACRRFYEPLLEWAYSRAEQCDVGDTKAIKRLATTFSTIDYARRLRNDIVHNQGLLSKRHECTALPFGDAKIILHPNYRLFKERGEQIRIRLTTDAIIHFGRSHVEVLHVLHNEIQKHCFGHIDPRDTAYDYEREKKQIEWDRVYSGV